MIYEVLILFAIILSKTLILDVFIFKLFILLVVIFDENISFVDILFKLLIKDELIILVVI